ncbi:MAG: protein-glutamate O-methyltransferase CheR [Polyangiaceae bacterium]
MPIDANDFAYVRSLVLGQAGVVIEADRDYLAEARLVPLAHEESFATLGELVARLRMTPVSALHRRVVDAMMINETSFFRDPATFDSFKKEILPDVLSNASAVLRIWCAACASGQEPYSVAMLLREHFGGVGADVKILASDISAPMVLRAERAIYSTLEVNRGLPAPMLVRNFEQRGAEWALKEDVRRMVEVRRINLMDESSWSGVPVDVLFLRNVLIYFAPEMKKRMLARAHSMLRPNGYLLLGGSETTIGLDARFEAVHLERCTWYRRKDA